MSKLTSSNNLSKMSILQNNKVVNMPYLGLRVFFAGRCFFSGAVAMFKDAGCEPADTVEDSELVVFLGGEDIDPALYGDRRHNTTHFNEDRDNREIEVFLKAQALDIPMFGICRGMQFLHAMAGGRLYQDVRNHAGQDHHITDLETGETLMSTSLHHQMCIWDGTQIAVAKSSEPLSKYYATGTNTTSGIAMLELEAAYYPGIRAFCTQGHPELGRYDEYTSWCLVKIQKLFEEEPKEQSIIRVTHRPVLAGI